jgi:hypothetical protein
MLRNGTFVREGPGFLVLPGQGGAPGGAPGHRKAPMVGCGPRRPGWPGRPARLQEGCPGPRSTRATRPHPGVGGGPALPALQSPGSGQRAPRSGRGAVWQRASFGTMRSEVQILSPRPILPALRQRRGSAPRPGRRFASRSRLRRARGHLPGAPSDRPRRRTSPTSRCRADRPPRRLSATYRDRVMAFHPIGPPRTGLATASSPDRALRPLRRMGRALSVRGPWRSPSRRPRLTVTPCERAPGRRSRARIGPPRPHLSPCVSSPGWTEQRPACPPPSRPGSASRRARRHGRNPERHEITCITML